MKKTAILAAEQIYHYPEENKYLLKRYTDLKDSILREPTLPLYLNHGGPVIGSFSALRGDDGKRHVKVDLDVKDGLIDSDLKKLLELDVVPISGEFKSHDYLLRGVHDGHLYDGYQSNIEWTGAALIWNSNQVARCKPPKCGVNLDANGLPEGYDGKSNLRGYPLKPSTGDTSKTSLVIKAHFDGSYHIQTNSKDDSMNESDTNQEIDWKAKYDALEQSIADAKHDALVEAVLALEGIDENHTKDACDTYLKGLQTGYQCRMDAEGAQKPAPQKCGENQRMDPQKGKCVNKSEAKTDTGDHAGKPGGKNNDAKQEDAAPPIPKNAIIDLGLGSPDYGGSFGDRYEFGDST
jgi:hypothetical protein